MSRESTVASAALFRRFGSTVLLGFLVALASGCARMAPPPQIASYPSTRFEMPSQPPERPSADGEKPAVPQSPRQDVALLSPVTQAGEPAAQRRGQRCVSTTERGNRRTVSRSFPSGSDGGGVIRLETTVPSEVRVGKTFLYKVTARNLTDCPVYDVTVVEDLSENQQLEASAPQAQLRGAAIRWDLGTLGPRESKTIEARLINKEAGTYEHCATVTFRPQLCQSVVAVSPELKVKKTIPATALACSPIPVSLTVSNTGTGTIRDVTVVDRLPEGLQAENGQRQLSFTVDSIASQGSETRRFSIQASRPGTYTNRVFAESADGLQANASARVRVRQPVLSIRKAATDRQFLGRHIVYTIRVRNRGDAPAEEVEVSDTIPENTTFASASDGGRLGEDGVVRWRLSQIPAGREKSLRLKVRAADGGVARNRVWARARCAAPAMAEVATDIVGVPAVLLEVVDVEDPIGVGDKETYRITVTNQGTAYDTNIQITCRLEESQTFASAGGATEATHRDGVVTFAPLAELGTKEKASWFVNVRAAKVDDVRFTVEMSTDELKRPVRETEATNQY